MLSVHIETLTNWRSLSAKAELSGAKPLSNYAKLPTRKETPESLCVISRKCAPSKAAV